MYTKKDKRISIKLYKLYNLIIYNYIIIDKI